MNDAAAGARTVQKRRLDTLLAGMDFPTPYLLKVDVDGAELAVLDGAGDRLRDCSVICIESPLACLHERIGRLTAAGFRPYDIVDLCYYDEQLAQVDLVFVRADLFDACGLNLWADGFDLGKWRDY